MLSLSYELPYRYARIALPRPKPYLSLFRTTPMRRRSLKCTFFHGTITAFRGEKKTSPRTPNGFGGPCGYTAFETPGWPNRLIVSD